jgi:F0F1-type ATP synthase membrane subunit b/b'
VAETVTGVVDAYSTRTKAERQLKKFERRGNTARNRVLREAKKNRNRIERTLTRNEKRVERNLKSARRDIERDSSGLRKNIEANVDLVTAQVENAVQTGITAGTKLAAVATDRVASAA